MRILLSAVLAGAFIAALFWQPLSIYNECRSIGQMWTRCILVVERDTK